MDNIAAFPLIDFGPVSQPVDALLQRGVAAYRRDKALADRLFREALDLAPGELPAYFCLYKIHTYQGNLDEALRIAERGLDEAARQAGWSTSWREWPGGELPDGPGRFAVYTLKALAFIHLRRDERSAASEILAALQRLDPKGEVGWPVVAALAAGLG
jgi:tetratricopeptide (TPR) repeat protein